MNKIYNCIKNILSLQKSNAKLSNGHYRYMTVEWILGIIGTALGGLNIFQFIFWKQERQKMKAEADSATIDAQQKRHDLRMDEYNDVLEQLTKYQNEYMDLAAKMQEEMRNHLVTINAKCNEIAELKSKLIYFKGLRCYKMDCSMRIKSNPKEKKDE